MVVGGAVMNVIAWSLDLQQPMQSGPIITNVVSLGSAHGEEFLI